MKIITLNTWGNSGPYEERWSFFLEELVTDKPDILCLQEVFSSALVEKVKKAFPYFNILSAYEAGLVIMTRFPVVESQIVKYKTISQNERENRQAILAKLEIDGKQITIANTHLSWRPEDETIRYKQVKELLQALVNKADTSLLAGDFNDVRGSTAIEEIERAGYLNLCQLCHPDSKNVTWDNQNPFIQTHSVKFPDRQIDFLFLHQKLITPNTIKSCNVILNHPNPNGIYPSDHYGILAEIKF